MKRQSVPTLLDLGQSIRYERRLASLTQSELARKARIAPNHLSRLESGEKIDPRFTTVVNIAAALGISLDVLAYGRNRPGLPPPLPAQVQEDPIVVKQSGLSGIRKFGQTLLSWLRSGHGD